MLENSRIRSTYASINLDNLIHNLDIVKKLVKPGSKILAAVKANAYGHGLVEISKALEEAGIDYLGVAIIEEAIELRNAGIKAPLFIFGPGRPEEACDIIKYNLTQTLTDFKMAEALSSEAVRANSKAKVHIKVDTGMGRLGFSCDETPGVVQKIKSLPGIFIEGIYSHFPSALSANKEYTEKQFEEFSRLLEALADDKPPVCHIANSMAILQFPESYMDMVRLGFILYGLYPDSGHPFKPVLTLKSAISHVKWHPEGSSVSYGLSYRTPKKTQIAVLPIGYGDGIPRALSNNGQVLINGKRFPIVGAVCMDQTLVDAGDEKVFSGMEVVIIGKQKGAEITATEIAMRLGTFENEIVTRITSRVPRIFFSEKHNLK